MFNRGDRVIVVCCNKYTRYDLVGLEGTVRSVYDNNVAVELDSLRNKQSGYGYFYFDPNNLKNLKGDNTIMEGNYRIANVQFLEGTNTEHTYRYALYDDGIVVDDICVVKSAHHGFGIARIVSIEPKTDERIEREIICRADFSAYKARCATRKRKAELKHQMATRAAQLQEIALYKMMAAEDPSMAELMREFDGLENC